MANKRLNTTWRNFSSLWEDRPLQDFSNTENSTRSFNSGLRFRNAKEWESINLQSRHTSTRLDDSSQGIDKSKIFRKRRTYFRKP